MAALFNKILYARRIPTQWKESVTIPIFKKGAKVDPKNYRGISLLSVVQKLLTKILAKEIAQTGISEEQQDFKQNRSTVDAIFILRQISEKAIEFNKTAFMCFVDLKQAFDRVRLMDVLQLLRARGISTRIIAAIRELNTDNTTIIRAGNVKKNSGGKRNKTGRQPQSDSIQPSHE